MAPYSRRMTPLSLIIMLVVFNGVAQGTVIQKCFGDYYSGTFADPPKLECTPPSVIKLNGGSYGVSQCTTNCCPDAGDCKVAMTDSDLDIVNIKARCEGGYKCPDAERAQRATINCGPLIGLKLSNYVDIDFECLIDGSTVSPSVAPTTTTGGSTSSTTTPGVPSNGTTAIVPTDPPKGELSTGTKVGIAFGVILGILLIILIIFAILVRRKNPNWPQTHNWKEPFRDYKSYMPDRVHSVVGRIKGRMGDITNPKSDYPPDIDISVTATSMNYQDASDIPNNRHPANEYRPNFQENPEYHQATLHAAPPQNAVLPGVQIVRTPQDAIDISETGRVDDIEEEPMYETIDDFHRGSLRRADSYDSFDSMPLDEGDPSLATSRMKINDVIYYGALEGNNKKTLEADNSMNNTGPSPKSSPMMKVKKLGEKLTEEMNTQNSAKPPASPKPSHKVATGPKLTHKTISALDKPPSAPQKAPAPTKPSVNKYSTAVPKSAAGAPPADAVKTGSGVPVTGSSVEDEAGQVYENTDFGEEDETYYNSGGSGPVVDDRYSKLDPSNLSPGGPKSRDYQPLSAGPSSSSC